MTTNHVDICGITPECELPRCYCTYPCKEICETHKLCIPNCKPDIENILQVFIDISINKSNILKTSMGKKLVIYGNIHIKILYDANTSCQSVHSAHFDVPFCTFILLNDATRDITDICLFIEDAFIDQLDSRNLSVSMIILVYPLLKNIDYCLKHSSNYNENYYFDNSKNKNFNYINNCTNGNEDCTIRSDSLPNIQNDSQLYENSNANFNMDSNKSLDIEYDKNSNIQDVNYDMNQSKTSDFEVDLKYDMNESKTSDIESDINNDMDYEDCIDSNFIYEDEYFENEWK